MPGNLLKTYLKKNLVVVFLLGISSGLPLAMVSTTLGYWLKESNISIKLIGAAALIRIFYNFKFLWSPAVDAVKIPFLTAKLGRRRSWLVAAQICLIGSILLLSTTDPATSLYYTVALALAVAFFSATQDIVIDAYRIEITGDNSQAAAATAAIYGYRGGMLISGAVALKLSEYVSWHGVYIFLACTILIGLFAALFGDEPAYKPNKIRDFRTQLHHAVVDPFTDFMKHKGWVALLIFIVLYKFSGAFLAGGLMSAFYLEMGFTKDQIIFAVNIFGLGATLLGLMAGGVLATKLGMIRALWIDAFLQAVTNLLFIPVIYLPNTYALAGAVAAENFASAMGTVVLVAFISRLCTREFSATQYALLSSLAAAGATFLAANSGWIVASLSWEGFYLITFLAGVPALVMIPFIAKYLPKPVDKAGRTA